MKIWIDFINTPQVTFFVPFIKEFKEDGNEVLLTCRDSGNTVSLLNQNKLSYRIIGNRAEKGLIKKLLSFPRRLLSLWLFIRKHKPEISVSQSSFYQPVVARFLRIPCLYTNDNEHAKGNLLGFLFANEVALPVAMRNLRLSKKWYLKSKLSFYPSVKEAIYLSQNKDLIDLASGEKSKIYFRPEPWTAQYYDGPMNFFDDTLIRLADNYEVNILPRDNNQYNHYNQDKFSTLKAIKTTLTMREILADCMLFIGAGGSMTREMAVMEVPVISIYKAELLAVDKYLEDNNVLKINPDITYDEIIEFINHVLKSKKDRRILKEGFDSYDQIKNIIYNLKHE